MTGSGFVCTHPSVCSVYLHRAVDEELLDIFSHTGCGHAFRVGPTDVPIGKSEAGEAAVGRVTQTHVANKCLCRFQGHYYFFMNEKLCRTTIKALTVHSPGRQPSPPAAVPPPTVQPTNPGHTPCACWTSHWPPAPPVALVEEKNSCE